MEFFGFDILEITAQAIPLNRKTKVMKNENSNRVNMINSTIGFSDANTAATAGIPSYATILGQVKSKMVLINSLNQIGSGTTKGVTLDTNLLRKTMSGLALKCANATLAFANSTGNNTLAALVNFSESKLNREKKEDVDDVCQGIHDATNSNIAGATNFGVVAADVTDLQAAIDLYRIASQNPRQAIITKTQAIRQVGTMVREVIDSLLIAQMDKMVNTLKATNKDFFNGYKQAREIIDLGTTTAKVRGVVLDVEDVPLKGVSFTISKTGTAIEVAKVLSDNKGKFNASKLPSGDYDFKFELSGYVTESESNVHISSGKELKRKIVMAKGGGSAVREGDVMMGMISNIIVDDIKGTPATTITIEVSGTALRFYASPSSNGAPSATFLDVQAGVSVTKTVEEFVAAIGLSDTNKFLNVQNVGAMQAHYRITFTNLG